MAIEYEGEGQGGPTVPRRWLGYAVGAGVVTAGLAAAAAFEAGSLLHPDSVPGFAWQLHSGFKDGQLQTNQAAHHNGDPNATSPIPSMWKRAMTIGTPAAKLFTEWAKQPRARLGVLYTDPGGNWHDGWAEPGQVYGGLVVEGGDAYLAAAVREGRNPADFTWALSGEGDQWNTTRLQLITTRLGELAVSDLPASIPLL